MICDIIHGRRQPNIPYIHFALVCPVPEKTS
jgi:hypothetical protein